MKFALWAPFSFSCAIRQFGGQKIEKTEKQNKISCIALYLERAPLSFKGLSYHTRWKDCKTYACKEPQLTLPLKSGFSLRAKKWIFCDAQLLIVDIHSLDQFYRSKTKVMEPRRTLRVRARNSYKSFLAKLS